MMFKKTMSYAIKIVPFFSLFVPKLFSEKTQFFRFFGIFQNHFFRALFGCCSNVTKKFLKIVFLIFKNPVTYVKYKKFILKK